MILGPPGVSLSDSLLPYTTLFRYPAATALDRSASSKANRSTHRPKPVSVKKKSVMSACSLAHSETLPAVLKRPRRFCSGPSSRSEEHTPELQSLIRTSYAVSCLNKTKHPHHHHTLYTHHTQI